MKMDNLVQLRKASWIWLLFVMKNIFLLCRSLRLFYILADKTLFDLHNSLYDTQPHPIIIGFTK